MYRVSAVVPIYHIKDELLLKSIKSLLNQDLEIEVLLIDDGSTEDNANMCDFFSTKYKNVKTIHCVNSGVSVARNVGIDNASGEYIYFMDPDDCAIGSIKRLVDVAEEKKYDILFFKVATTGGRLDNTLKMKTSDISNIEPLYKKTINVGYDELFPGSIWGKLFRKSFLDVKNIRFVPGVVKAQDRIFMIDCYNNLPLIGRSNFYGYEYNCKNEESICHKFNPEIVNILDKTAHEMRKRINTQIYKKELNYMYISFLYESIQLYFGHLNNPKKNHDLNMELKELATNERYATALKECEIKKLSKRSALMVFLLRLHLYGIVRRIV